ncbi:MAG: hypothetical protein M3Q68_06570 [Actinomycetota bacterium]|nr:hypothetical protein [Actinomycetota bacterium]
MRRSLVTGGILLAFLALFASCTDDDDRERTKRPERPAVSAAAPVPEARTEVGAGRLGNDILVLGGLRADGTATDRVDRFDLADGTWSDGVALPSPLHHAGVASFGDRLWVAGGYTPAGDNGWIESARVWSLGDGEGAWRSEPDLRTARGALGLAAAGARLVALGGTSAGQVLSSVEVMVAGEDAWRPAPPMRQAREHTAAAAVGGRVYAIGGRVGGLETNLTSVESLQPGAFAPEWTKEPDLGTPRGGIAAAVSGGRVCVAGGEAPTGTIATVECLDGRSWIEAATLLEARHGLGVVAGLDGALHVLAGGPEPGLFVSTAHEVLTLDR